MIRSARLWGEVDNYRSKLSRGFQYFTDFTGTPPDMISAASGTGSASSGTPSANSGRPGIVQPATGTTDTGVGGFWSNVASVQFGGGAWVWEGDFNVVVLSTVSEEFKVRLGFFDVSTAAGTPADGVWFEYDRLTGVNWLCKTNDNTTPTSVDSSVAVAANAYKRFKIEVNAAGTEAKFYIQNALVATIATTVPTGVGRETQFGFVISKSAGTTTRTLRGDWMAAEFNASSSDRPA